MFKIPIPIELSTSDPGLVYKTKYISWEEIRRGRGRDKMCWNWEYSVTALQLSQDRVVLCYGRKRQGQVSIHKAIVFKFYVFFFVWWHYNFHCFIGAAIF